jgi:trehalose/maltose transport system substrate-binding protein
MKIIHIFGLLLVSACLGCSGHSPQQPVTLAYLDVEWDTPDNMPALAQDLQDFTRETGIQVRRLPRPDGSLNQLALWRELLQKGAAAPDVVSIDVIWSGILSQYLMDLKPYFAAELSTEDPAVVATYTVDAKALAIPHHTYVGVLFYRPDLLRRYGYPEPPKTWDQLETMATRIQAGERARGEKDFWGYVWEGGLDEDLTCNALEWQVSDDGGRIIEDDRTITVNNRQAIGAWQRAAGWVGSISPPGVVAFGKWDAQNVWGAGKAAFLRSWDGDYGLIHRGWPLSGSPAVRLSELGVTSVPGGRAARTSTLGGNGLAISRASVHTREALELVRFLIRRDAEELRAPGHLEPRDLSLYELPRIFKVYPEVAKSKGPGARLVARPSVPAGSRYEDVTRAYIGAVHSVLTREKIPSAAAADLERELVAITGFRTSSPRIN